MRETAVDVTRTSTDRSKALTSAGVISSCYGRCAKVFAGRNGVWLLFKLGLFLYILAWCALYYKFNDTKEANTVHTSWNFTVEFNSFIYRPRRNLREAINDVNIPATTDATCRETRQIVFLKTHKTAGSTVQNIFMRYGYRKNLTFVLPTVSNSIGYPLVFNHRMVPFLKGDRQYDLLCFHCRFNYYEMRSIMPEQTKFITIVRDPVSVFESLYSYFKLQRCFGLNISDFASNSDHQVLDRRCNRSMLGRNQMIFDLGLNPPQYDDYNYVTDFVTTLDSKFDLVMVAERFDESLVLLRHLLCWSLDDVIAFKQNARIDKFKMALPMHVKNSLRELNRGDAILYDYFTDRLDERIAAFGVERMAVEVLELRSRRDYWYGRCVEREGVKGELPREMRPVLSFVKGFQLRAEAGEVCQDLARPEMIFKTRIMRKQKALELSCPGKEPC